jgi:transposase
VAKKRRAFSLEFKEEACKMVIDESRAVAEVAREISVNEQTLRNWEGRVPEGACG